MLRDGAEDSDADALDDSDSLHVDVGDEDRVRVDDRDAPLVVDGVGDTVGVLEDDCVKFGVTEGEGVSCVMAATELCFLMTKTSGVLPAASTNVPVSVDPSREISTMNEPPTASPANPFAFAVIRTLAG